MKPAKNPIHINAKKEDVADIVLFPGDPLRAKYIAENFLSNCKEINNVRNMLGYTGYYKDKRVTVIGHGMGMPSISIYAFELFYFYNVQKIIRIGTCGVCSPEVHIPEIIIADKIYSESNFGFQYDGFTNPLVYPNHELVNDLVEIAKIKNYPVHVGTVTTSDVFGPYADDDAQIARIPKELNVLGEEMEGYALIHLADIFNRKAAVVLTATDSKYSEKELTPEERRTSLNDMISLGLEALIK